VTSLLLSLVLILSAALAYLLFFKRGADPRSFTEGEPTGEDSLKDGVTQLYNKTHLMQRLQDHIGRADRDKKTFSLVLWDIEGFSSFNNEFGQKEGDRLLRRVAVNMRKAVRGYDEIFRCGPDEFCAILLPADPEIAKQVTARVSQLVSKELFEEGEYAPRKFSLPAGMVFYPEEAPSPASDRSPDALLHAVNQALYKARLAPISPE
jgi:diguanylate cyclase (GGDEF)-like protein